MTKNKDTIIYIISALSVIGLGTVLYLKYGRPKRKDEDYIEDDEGGYKTVYNPQEASGEVPKPPAYVPPPTSSIMALSKYNTDDIRAMQNYMLLKGDKSVINMITTTGGADGIKGDGFNKALKRMIAIGKVNNIDDLYKKATFIAPAKRPKRYLPEGRYHGVSNSLWNRMALARRIIDNTPLGIGLNSNGRSRKVQKFSKYGIGYLYQFTESLGNYDGFIYKGKTYSNKTGIAIRRPKPRLS